jgi:hypothetical protein
MRGNAGLGIFRLRIFSTKGCTGGYPRGRSSRTTHVNHHSRQSGHDGGQRRNGQAYLYSVIESDEEIENIVHWEIVEHMMDPCEKLLIVDVVHKKAAPSHEFETFTQSEMDTTQQNRGRQNRGFQ